MIKKIFSFVLAAIIIFSCVSAFSADEIILAVNGKKLETQAAPFMQDGTTMVPIAGVLRALGYEVAWFADSQLVNATSVFHTVTLIIGKSNIIVDGNTVPVSHAPFLLNGTTYVPVRSVCEMLGCMVEWNGDYGVINITTTDYNGPKYVPATSHITTPENTTDQTTVLPSENNDKPSIQDSTVSQPITDNNYIETISPGPVTFSKDNKMNTEMIAGLINEKRAEYGCSVLEYDDNIAAVAQRHSTDMKDYYSDNVSHFTPNSDEDPFDRLDNANILYIDAAEVLASGFTKPEDVVRSWMNSSAHKEVILDPDYTHIGVGYDFGGSNGTYWTVYLISR